MWRTASCQGPRSSPATSTISMRTPNSGSGKIAFRQENLKPNTEIAFPDRKMRNPSRKSLSPDKKSEILTAGAKSDPKQPSARLSHHVDHCGLATHDDSKRAAQCWTEIFRIGDGPFAVDAQPARDRRVIDVGIFDGGTDAGVGDAALMAVGHALDMHDLLMVRAIVVHNTQQRN